MVSVSRDTEIVGRERCSTYSSTGAWPGRGKIVCSPVDMAEQIKEGDH
jgi:hypothetical protein